MPISKENQKRYPKYWKALSFMLRNVRACNRCECNGQCGINHNGRCLAVNYKSHPRTGSKVILTTAHLNHTPEDCREENLLVMCQDCHLRYDKYIHAFNRNKTMMIDFNDSQSQSLSIYLSRFKCKSTKSIISKSKTQRYGKTSHL